ncbi:RNA-directed DNA polymerase, eukaryota, partial [Tanacetum coccineum]
EEEGSVENSSNADGGKVKAEEEELMGGLFCNDDNETPPNMKKNLDAQPSNSDPFELEHLIAINGNYKSNKQGSSTPKFPPGFTQSDDGDKQNDFSDVNKPEHSIQSSQVKDDEVPREYVGVSMIQQVEDTIKVGIALGFNMDGCQDMLQKMIADMGDDIETKLLRVDLWSLRQKDSIICADNYVAAQGTWIQNGLKIMFIAVYAPQSLASKIVLWSTLSQLISNWDGHAIVMGDFNEVREAADRSGSVFNERHAEIFNSFITNMNLFDVPLGGFRFTWIDKWASKMSKLDRFLATEGFHDTFPNITGIILEKGIPDHRPILLKESVVDYGPTPFRFFHSWLECEGFYDLVVDTWKSYDSGDTNGMISFKKKLQNLKQVIRSWSSSKKLSDNQMKKEHQDRLSLIDAKVDQGSASSDDLTLRISSLKILGDIERKEASDLAQKAKVKWALEGDENTSFFHGSLKKKRRESAIKGILKNGVWIDDPGEVKHEFYTHFCNRFSCTGASRPIIEDVDFKQISVEQQEFLECDVSNEEIKKAVWNCGSDRAPGPDGFTFKFFKTFWDVIQNDVVRFVREFFQSACFPKGCNSSFIALIPKIGDAKFVSDFRPISLIGCQYKIIGKLLANRLSTVIGSCVSFEQSAFIKGRNILDGPLVLNECMAWYRKRSKALMVFKVDFEKAFDSLRWDYLDVIMEKLGFGFKWRMWIYGCLKYSRASILINGSPTPELDMFNGLRQGDPMSPFLFILAMEGLHALVSKAVATGLFKGASIGRGNINVSHLLYADDAIFVGEWSHSNAYNLLCLLRCFYTVSGLKINVHKSKILGVNVLDEEVSSMALVLGCGVAKLPMMYLGVPIGCNMGRCDNWKRVVQKFESKMNRWKAKLLSVGGRLSLIKAVLGNLPTYYMSLYSMPITVQKRLESIRNRFFIGGDSDDKKITWVKWNSCLASKAMGGLGIGSIFALNVALLFKWIWRFRTTSNSLWVNVIKDIHGHDGGIGSGRVGKLSHSPWNSIIRTLSHLQAKGIDLLALCGRSLGDGNSISYWGDKWCGTRPLKDSFPRVYALDDNKLCTVAQRINIEDWSFVLRRPPRGGAESYQLDELIQFTRDVVLSDSADAWTWELDKSGYSVSSARIHIDEHTLNGTFTSTRWLRCIPIKVNVFIWRLRLDKLSTLVNMDRKGIDVDSLLCPICKAHVENVDHLFFSCEMAHDLWGLLARWCNLDIPEVSNITEWFSWLDDAHVSKSARVILEGIASTMLWFIWNFRNACIFSSSKPKKANVWDSIVHYSFLWISSRNPKSRFRWIDWLGNPIDTLTSMHKYVLLKGGFAALEQSTGRIHRINLGALADYINTFGFTAFFDPPWHDSETVIRSVPNFRMSIKAITGSLHAGFFSVVRSITSDILTNFPELRFIITTTPGIDHINLHQCRSRGIKVANACTIFSEDVAHMDVGLLIDVLTRHAETKVKDWENDDDPVSVAGDNDEVDQSPTFTNITD